MYTSKIVYQGDLRTQSTHLQSGTVIITDAPTDNQGKGEAFSPTDMVANSLATCMFSIMGIKAKQLDVNLTDSTANVTKIMQAEPRMIKEVVVNFDMNAIVDEKTRIILERAAMTCPVYLSLHPDILKSITFKWK